MVDVAYPLVYAALLPVAELAVAEMDVRVVDGYDESDDPSDVILLGIPNVNDTSSISAGGLNQEQMGHGATGVIRETGTVNGLAMATTGNGGSIGAQQARIAATGYVAALAAGIRADRSLGLNDEGDEDGGGLNVVAQMGSLDVAEDKVDGATCVVSFVVNYIALLG